MCRLQTPIHLPALGINQRLSGAPCEGGMETLAEQVLCIQSALLIRMFTDTGMLINAEVLVCSEGQRDRLKCQVIYWEGWDVFGCAPVPLNLLFQSPSHYRRSVRGSVNNPLRLRCDKFT